MNVARDVRLTITALALSACGTASPPREHEPPAAPAPKTAEPAPPATPAATPAAPQEDCVDEPGMVHIAGGDYFSAKDKKTHPLAPFWLDRTEVTVKSYRAFVAAGNPPPHAPGEAKQSGLVCTWSLPDNDELPINCIDWHQADAYCRWAGKRLPTAQEWGWAAQGREEDRRYPWGDAKPSCDLAVIDQDRTDAVMGCGRNQPWPVGTKPTDVTRDGVLDMFGNVGEPTSSGFNEDEKSTRVGKGASWATAASERQTVDEFGWYVVRESWGHGAGVRCAKDATVVPGPSCHSVGPE